MQELPLTFSKALVDTVNEYHRAKAKHGEMTLDGKNCTDINRLAALMEECGEAAAEMTYDKGSRANLYKELIQVANVALTWAAYVNDGTW